MPIIVDPRRLAPIVTDIPDDKSNDQPIRVSFCYFHPQQGCSGYVAGRRWQWNPITDEIQVQSANSGQWISSQWRTKGAQQSIYLQAVRQAIARTLNATATHRFME